MITIRELELKTTLFIYIYLFVQPRITVTTFSRGPPDPLPNATPSGDNPCRTERHRYPDWIDLGKNEHVEDDNRRQVRGAAGKNQTRSMVKTSRFPTRSYGWLRVNNANQTRHDRRRRLTGKTNARATRGARIWREFSKGYVRRGCVGDMQGRN